MNDTFSITIPKVRLQMLITAALTAVLAAFLYSARPLGDCIIISVGISLAAAAIFNICQACEQGNLTSITAALLLAFSPFMTEIAILNPYLPIISAIAFWAFSLWVRALFAHNAKFWLPVAAIAAPISLLAIFYCLANPTIMNTIGFSTSFPMPTTERPYFAFAKISASSYDKGFPVAVGYLTLLLAPFGLYKLNLNTALALATAGLFAVAGLDKPLLNTPPAIWAIFAVFIASFLAARTAANIGLFMENRFQVRPFWLSVLPILETITITYLITY